MKFSCNKDTFLREVQRRGYAVEDVMPCVLAQRGDRWTVDSDHASYPHRNRPKQKPPPPPPGPGTELKALLKKVGITASPGCSCNKRAQLMDENEAKEPGWCEKNLETICDWLQEEADKRKLPFVRMAAKILVRQAIRNARKKGQ